MTHKKVEENDKGTTKGHVYNQWLVTLIVNTVFFTCGLQNGWISPAIQHLTSDSSPTGAPISAGTLDWIASIQSIGAMIAVPGMTYFLDRFGRKAAVLLITVPQIICWILKLYSGSVAGLIVARMLCGMAASSSFAISVYIKEISQEDMRGVLGATITVFYNLGILAIYAIGGYMDYSTTMYSVCWMPVVTILLMIKVPESPAYLVKIGEKEKAISTLAWLRRIPEHDTVVQKALESLENEVLSMSNVTSISFLNIMKNPSWRKGFFIVMAIFSVQAWSGTSVVMTYALPLLEMAQVTFSPELQVLTFPLVLIIGSLGSMVTVEKVGRKPLLTLSLLASSATLFGLATCLLLIDLGNPAPSWLPVVLLMAYLLAFSSGLLPLPYTLSTEMFNVQVRATLVGYITMFTAFMAFIQMNTYSTITSHATSTPFFLYATINLLGVFLVLFFLPETKARSVKEIDKLLLKRALC